MTSLLRKIREIVGFNPVLWETSRRMMDRRVAEFLPEIKPGGAGPEILVIVTPWQGTAIPWFSLALGLLLAREGAKTRFVVDDLPYGGNAIRHRLVLRAIDHVMKRVAQRFPVTRLSDAPRVPASGESLTQIERVARYNATWTLRGEMPKKGRATLVEREMRENRLAQEHISGFFEEQGAPDVQFTPSGVFSHSAIWVREAQRLGVRVATYDSGGYDTTMLATSGMACQLEDVPTAFRHFKERFEEGSPDWNAAMARAEEEIGKRRAGIDTFVSQSTWDNGETSGDSPYLGGILLALNSSWDAAALGPHRVYEDSKSWIVDTVAHLLANSDCPVLVRQHPAERLAIAATSDDYGALLKMHIGDHPRLHFISAHDPINSYALLRQVRAVVVHTSTIGVEAVALGVPAITSSAPYYGGLGFVAQAQTFDEYYAVLDRAARGELAVSDAMSKDAKLCYYLTQCCNWVFSTFNPATYKRWVEQPLAHWYDEPAVHRMVRAIAEGTPVALLNHEAQKCVLKTLG